MQRRPFAGFSAGAMPLLGYAGVNKGEMIVDGPVDPHDLLRLLGVDEETPVSAPETPATTETTTAGGS